MAKAKCMPVLGCGEVCPLLECPRLESWWYLLLTLELCSDFHQTPADPIPMCEFMTEITREPFWHVCEYTK